MGAAVAAAAAAGTGDTTADSFGCVNFASK